MLTIFYAVIRHTKLPMTVNASLRYQVHNADVFYRLIHIVFDQRNCCTSHRVGMPNLERLGPQMG